MFIFQDRVYCEGERILPINAALSFWAHCVLATYTFGPRALKKDHVSTFGIYKTLEFMGQRADRELSMRLLSTQGR